LSGDESIQGTTSAARAAPLDYAPALLWRRRRSVRRAAALIVLLTLSLAAWRYGPHAWSQATLLYRQRQCLTYQANADMVVFEQEPVAAAALMTSDRNYAPYFMVREQSRAAVTQPATTTAASFTPACWNSFASRLTPTFARWNTLSSGMATGGTPSVAFLHERTSPAGHRRLVAVRLFPPANGNPSSFVQGYDVFCEVIVPATSTTPPAPIAKGFAFSVLSSFIEPLPEMRVYAGQPDNPDTSRFTIRYEMWGQTDVLDGQLHDDDSVTLKPRRRPSPPPMK
jgi:hypothetical protein